LKCWQDSADVLRTPRPTCFSAPDSGSRCASRFARRTSAGSWLKIFTSLYVLVGIGILVELARRLGMGFIASRDELAAEKEAKEAHEDD